MMQWVLIVKLATANLRRYARRSLFVLLAMMLGVSSMVFMDAMIRGWTAASIQTTISHFLGEVQVEHPQFADDPLVENLMEISPAQMQFLQSQARYAMGTLRLGAIIQSAQETLPVMMIGVEGHKAMEQTFLSTALLEGQNFDQLAPGQMVIGRDLAQRLSIKLGQRLVLSLQNAQGELSQQGFKLVATYQAHQKNLEKSWVFIHLGDGQKLAGVSGQSYSHFQLTGLSQALDLATKDLSQRFPQWRVTTWLDKDPYTAATLAMSKTMTWVWLLMVFVLIAFGLINLLLMQVYERLSEFGLLRAIGASAKMVATLVAVESAMLMALGVVLGILLGVLILVLLGGELDLSSFAAGASYVGISQTIPLEFAWVSYAVMALAFWLLGVMTSLYPALRAAQATPLSLIRQHL